MGGASPQLLLEAPSQLAWVSTRYLAPWSLRGFPLPSGPLDITSLTWRLIPVSLAQPPHLPQASFPSLPCL